MLTDEMADAAEMLWVVLANVSDSDWSKQSAEWQEAAARWRDNYFAVVARGSIRDPLAADQREAALSFHGGSSEG